ncbi:MAG: HAMP domain-containing histidine kinase [Planctomycetaceae bacterium]|nr:HAMP domain-containing histidine kinase [Planctomycetaceae bacterium]
MQTPANHDRLPAVPVSGRRRFPLRYQVLVPMLATLVVTLVVISLLTAGMAARNAAARVDADVARIAKTLRATTFPLTQPVLDNIAGLSGAELLLTNSANQVVASTTRVDRSGWQPVPPAAAERPGDLDRIDLGGEWYFHRVSQLARPAQAGELYHLHVLYPEAAWRRARREAVLPPLLIGAVGAAFTAGLSILLSRRVTRPISRIAELMADLAAGRYVAATLPARNDELRDLTLAANGLAAQLDELHGAIRRGERLTLLGQLSGGLAHQMRNSAAGARLAIQLHRRACSASDRETIDVALRQLELVEEQLVSFLALGKPQQPRQVACDLALVVDEVRQLVAANARHRSVELAVEVPAAGARATADADQIRQVLINLTLNALDAVERGGRVRLVLAEFGDRLRLAVLDSGRGVRPEIADSLFEPFSTTKPEGVGLGLAVAARIVAAHGGQLRWSRLDYETCFEFTLPLGPAPSATGATSEPMGERAVANHGALPDAATAPRDSDNPPAKHKEPQHA